MATDQEQWLRCRGAEIAHAVTDGPEPLLVRAHGFTASRAAEDALSHALDWTPLSANRRVLRYDARGHGHSTGRAAESDYMWSNLGLDLLELLDELGAREPVDVLGASMGTATALWAAVHEPARLRRLVLTIPPNAWRTRAEQAGRYREQAEQVERHGLKALLELRANEPPLPIFAGLSMPEPRIEVAESLLPSMLRGMGRSDLPDERTLSAIEQPTLILAWETDPGHPLSTATELARLLPNARLHVSGTAEDVRTWSARAAAFLDETD